MKFTFGKPFVTSTGKVVTMKSLVTINGVVHVETQQDKKRYFPETLIPISQRKYNLYLEERANEEERAKENACSCSACGI